MKPSRLACALALACMAALAGCENKLDPKECDKLRGEAFDLVNKGQQCNTDADCRQSEWPGCERAISNATYDKIKPMSDKFKEGKCEEPKMECRKPPEAYCKQGLCVHREKGVPEGAGNTPADQIQFQ
ncbi:MAG: hypothetical protein HUU21_37045 [Polyangiaceae bacterium]|nr:hypothetical protein [Polyangiaceae bacterium]NUQ79155.1 hypothetical protein [Polyangiaceae bacterium]